MAHRSPRHHFTLTDTHSLVKPIRFLRASFLTHGYGLRRGTIHRALSSPQRCRVRHCKLNTSKFTHRIASTMAAHFLAKPEFVQLTEWGTGRVPQGSSWMIFEVDSVAPSCTHPGAWVVHVRDYRYGADPAGLLGRDYQIWSLTPGDYEAV